MDVVPVTIVRFVDDDFPGFVECVMVDSGDLPHRFVEKAPVVSTADLSLDSVFPQPGQIACVVEDELVDELGRQLVRVITTSPWAIESTAGEKTIARFSQTTEPL